MKIGILTFHCAINYGAVLQAYGLQEYLKSLGHTVNIIDYHPDYLLEPYKNFKSDNISKTNVQLLIKTLVRECIAFFIRLKRKKKFKRFINNNISLDNLDLLKEDNDYDLFIFGSDQIWNPKLTNGLDDAYIGNLPAFRRKTKLSYAASVGNLNYLLDKEVEDKLVNSLNCFRAVSVRETPVVDFFSSILDTPVYNVLDPVLLAGLNAFNGIIKEPTVKSSYLLVFTLDNNEYARHIGHEIAESLDLPVVELVSSKESICGKGIKQCLSPESFLGYLKKAEYVITSSFHGTAFSILFNKNFNVISSDKNINERAYSLLKILNLEDRMITYNSKSYNIDKIDYSSVVPLLEEQKIKSYSFISSFLQKKKA